MSEVKKPVTNVVKQPKSPEEDAPKMIRKNTKLSDYPVDNTYTNIRKQLCQSASIVDIQIEERFDFDKDPYACGGDVLSFYRDKDFKMLEVEAGSMEIDREDKTSTQALKQTEASMEQALSWEQEFPIQAKYGDRLNTFLVRVLMNERESGRNGKGIIAYSNSGISYEKIVTFNKGKTDEFKVKLYFPYLKVKEWPNVYMGDLTAESTVNLSVLIENWPVITFEGASPIWFGIPTELTAPEITYDTMEFASSGTLTISNLLLTDPSLVALDEKVEVSIFDGATGVLISKELTDGSSAKDYTKDLETSVKSIVVRIGYNVGENFIYITDTEKLEQTSAMAFRAKTLVAPEITAKEMYNK